MTTSEFLLHCTHRLSASTSNLFPWLQTQRLLFPLWREVNWFMDVCSTVLLVFTLPWPTGLVLYLASTRCTSGYAVLYQDLSYNVGKDIRCCRGVLQMLLRVQVTGENENCQLCSATRDSSLRKWRVKTPSVCRTIIILNVFRNRKCKSPI